MLEFVQRFFGKPSSSATAKERLRLVLLSDHLSLAPDVVEALKHDLVDVISRYVEVDVANCDVSFEQQDKGIAMLANIPILGMHRPSSGSGQAPPPAAEPPPLGNPAGASAAVTIEIEPEITVTPARSTGSGQAGGSRRKRRRRRAAAPLGAAAPQPG